MNGFVINSPKSEIKKLFLQHLQIEIWCLGKVVALIVPSEVAEDAKFVSIKLYEI